jgi:hypothetical protein
MRRFDLAKSRALWNRRLADLESDEVLAQILDQGELDAWRELYRLASGPTPSAQRLRRRIIDVCRRIPVAYPYLFLAAMAALGEELDPYPAVPQPSDERA